jgi:hypothetical protein
LAHRHSTRPEGPAPLRRIGLRHDRKDPAWETAFPPGEILRYPQHTPYYQWMDTGEPGWKRFRRTAHDHNPVNVALAFVVTAGPGR